MKQYFKYFIVLSTLYISEYILFDWHSQTNTNILSKICTNAGFRVPEAFKVLIIYKTTFV